MRHYYLWVVVGVVFGRGKSSLRFSNTLWKLENYKDLQKHAFCIPRLLFLKTNKIIIILYSDVSWGGVGLIPQVEVTTSGMAELAGAAVLQ